MNLENFKGIYSYCGWNGGKLGWLLQCSVVFPYDNEDKKNAWTQNVKRKVKLPRPINLGCKRELISRDSLNYNSRNAVDKVNSFRMFDAAGVPHPMLIPARTIRSQSSSVPKKFLGRNNRSCCGRGITLYDRTNQWPVIDKHSFFVEFLECKSEHRVHVFNGEVVCELNKNINPNSFIHTREQGSTLSLGTIPHPKREDILNISIKAVKALSLDFGAVDIFIDINDRIYVLGVNSDPGMPNMVAPMYAEKIRKFFGMPAPEHYRIDGDRFIHTPKQGAPKKYSF